VFAVVNEGGVEQVSQLERSAGVRAQYGFEP
jgi:hypothetical protein